MMIMALFLILFFLNIVIAKYFFGGITSPIGVYGSTWLGLISTTQMGIVKYNQLGTKAVIIFIGTYFSFLLGATLVRTTLKKEFYITYLNTKPTYGKFNVPIFDKIIKCLMIISILCVLFSWVNLIKHFGSIYYIFNHAFSVRMQLIGDTGTQIQPLWLSYLSSTNSSLAALCAFGAAFLNPRKKMYYVPILTSLMFDLTNFGRVNTIWTLCLYIGAFCISLYRKKIKINRKLLWRVSVFVLLAVLLLSTPKLIRGQGSFTADNYGVSGLNTTQQGFITLYVYATGSFIAFSNYLENDKPIEHTYGEALALPVVKILNRIGIDIGTKYSYLYEMTNIPFEFNVYTYLREVYSDFGYFGLLVIPYLFGIFSTYLSFKIKNNTLKSNVILQYFYLMILFGVIYDPFLFGTNMIGLVVSILVTDIYRLLAKKKGIGHKRHLVDPIDIGCC